MENLDLDIVKNLNSPGNFDTLGCRYQIKDLEKDFTVIYPSYELETLDFYFFRLLFSSSVVNFKPEWYMRPDYVSYEMYNTTIFWYIILYVNFVNSIEEFKNFDKILVPNRDTISEMIADKVPRSDIRNMETIQPSFLLRFLKAKKDKGAGKTDSVPKNVAELMNTEKSIDSEVKRNIIETEDIYVLNSDNIKNKYVILKHEPINETSIIVNLLDLSVPLKFGYDYIVANLGNKKILTWNNQFCIGGNSVLNSVLRENSSLKVRCLTKNSSMKEQ